MERIDTRDLIAGLTLAALGAFVAWYASDHYAIGRVSRMGPGFAPVALGCVLAGLGTIIALLALRKAIPTADQLPFEWRPLLAVLTAVLVFSGLVERLGLVPATVALVMLAALAEKPYKPKRTLLLGLCVSALAWLIFSVGLQMTLPAFNL